MGAHLAARSSGRIVAPATMPSAKIVPAATNKPRRGGIRGAVRGTGATSRLPRQVASTEMNRPLKINDYIHNVRGLGICQTRESGVEHIVHNDPYPFLGNG